MLGRWAARVHHEPVSLSAAKFQPGLEMRIVSQDYA